MFGYDPTRTPAALISQFESLEGRMLLAFSTATAISSSINPSIWGQQVTFTATVTAGSKAPGGTVNFRDGTKLLGTGTIDTLTKKAVFSTNLLSVGAHSVNAVYTGTAKYKGSASSNLAHTVNKSNSAITLTVSDNSVALGTAVNFTARVFATAPGGHTPKGSVTFKEGSTVLGTFPLNKKGRAVLTEYNWFTGTHNITATYAGNANYNAPAAGANGSVVISEPTYTTTATGLKKATILPGAGIAAANGDFVRVDYTGYLTNGTKFDSSLNTGRTPFEFGIGQNAVIDGWDEGVPGMQVGETRVLRIPPELGYKDQPNGNIPANSTLIFVIKMLAIDVPRLGVLGGSNFSVDIPHNGAASTTNGTNFGSRTVNSTSAANSFGLTLKDQSFSLNLTGDPFVSISGTNAGDFILTQPSQANGFVMTIAFKPKAKGTRTATVNIPTNDPGVPTFKFNLTGVGT